MSSDTDPSGVRRPARRSFAWMLSLSAGLGLGALGVLDALWGLATGPKVSGALGAQVVVQALALCLVAGLGLGLAQGAAVWTAAQLARPLGAHSQRGARLVAVVAMPTVPLGMLGLALLRARWAHLSASTSVAAAAGLALGLVAAGIGAALVLWAGPWLDVAPRRRLPRLLVPLAALTVAAVGLDRALLVRLYPELHLALALGAAFGAELTVLCILWPARTGWASPARRPAAAGLALALGLVLAASRADPEAYSLAMGRTVIHAKILRLARSLLDLDGDGYSALLGGGDCDDRDPSVHPGAVDLPENLVDDDCSGGDLTLEMLRPSLAARRAEPAPSAARPLNVVLITIDAVRWDHLGAYGDSRNASPNIDRLAGQAQVFERAYASSSNTSCSFPSLLTGRYPSSSPWSFDPALQVDEGWPFLRDEDNVTLPELLAAAGLVTAAAVRGEVVYHLGLRQGFERATSHDELTPKVIGDVLDWVGRRRFFAWFHVDYPHHPYEPNDQVAFGDSDDDRYDGEIARADADVGNVLDGLEERGLGDRTAVVLTSDHGEAFGEHGDRFHATSLHEEQIHVPLLLRIPGQRARRTARPVGLVDVVPTLLECVGAPVAPELDGVSLLREPPAGLSTAYSELYDGTLRQRSLVRGSYKLIDHLQDHRLLLYDLASDPAERRNLAATRPEVTADLLGALSQVVHRKTLLMLALSRRGDRGSVVQLARSLEPIVQPELRQYAVETIGRSGVDEAVEPLVTLATSSDARPEARVAALRALAALGGDAARATLEAMAATEGPTQAAARELLSRSVR